MNFGYSAEVRQHPHSTPSQTRHNLARAPRQLDLHTQTTVRLRARLQETVQKMENMSATGASTPQDALQHLMK